MNSLYFLFLFLLLNSIWLIYMWKTDNTLEEFSPKFISSSYDEKLKIQFKSQVLQSLSPYLFRLFPSSSSIITSHTGDIPIGTLSMSEQLKREKEYNKSLLHQSDIGKNKLNSDYEMFLDQDKKNIFILKLHVNYNYSNDISIISMYSIPIDNFIISTREEYNLNKSCINKIWELKIDGIIQKYSISQDKKYLGIIINKIKKNNIISTVKYIELFNINDNTLNNSSISNTSDIVTNLTNETIITNETNNLNLTNEEININKTKTNNIINKDEILIDGNIPLLNIDVSKDIIVLSRERKEFVDILVRNNSNNKWEEYDINEIFINEKNGYNHKDNNNNLTNETINDYNNNSIITYYNRINSFKIIEDDNNKLSILELYISIKSPGIFAYSVIINFNKNNFSSELIPFFSHRLDKQNEDVGKNISYIYDIKSSLSQLKESYFHNSIFSKNSLNFTKFIIFEFFHRTIVSLNISTLELEKITSLSLGVNSINSDLNNNNLISIDSKKNIYYFYKRDDDDIYEDFININLDNIPNKYRKSEILASFIETFEKDKTRLVILLNKGVIISFDFGKIIKKMNRNIITIIISDYFYTIFMFVFNLLILFIVVKKRWKKKQRNNDIRNVIGNLGNLRRN